MESGIIRRLDEVVVNRIAAGEIIQRPANALKELLENSLDAKSTAIKIIVKSGGLKYLQIQDNGTGIRHADLDIVCERFTTSKLQNFDDLAAMKTFGFRGEALASISHVAHLTIQTKTADPTVQCAYRASYSDGKLIASPKPCAGNQGTQITVEDLFYNAPQRRQAFKTSAEEFQRIVDVVSKYAVHNPNVGFSVKKQGENNALRTQSNGTVLDNIALIYGSDVGRELIHIQLSADNDQRLQFAVTGFITNINYSTKKRSFLLFINNRLVDLPALKVAIDEVYDVYLPKGMHPFVYISLNIDAANVDVNVHPTKHEVHFLYEDEIVEQVKLLIERTLLGRNDSRKYYSQARLPGTTDPMTKKDTVDSGTSVAEKVYAKDLVRSDSKLRKLDKFFGDATLLQPSQSDISLIDSNSFICDEVDQKIINRSSSSVTTTPLQQTARSKKSGIYRKKTELSSILKIRKNIENDCNVDLKTILSNLSFVGCVNRKQSLIQYETNLYLCDDKQLSEELFYQILLYDFENFAEIKFEEPGLDVRALVMYALQSEDSGWTPDDGPIEDLASTVQDILVKKSAILREYYSLLISNDGRLLQLPSLLEHHQPSLAHLPMYLLRLATEVDWESEREFFESFSRETAAFYAIVPSELDAGDDANTSSSRQWYTEHVLYAELKDQLLPPQKFAHNKSLLQIASLSNLYKVFERC